MPTTTIQINRGAAANDGTGTPLRDFALAFNNFNFSYGTYTPTLFNVTNVAASTAYECQFMRIGNIVTVSGKVDIDPTLALTTELGISLPISSNLATQEQCAGSASYSGGENAPIIGDPTANRASLFYVAIATTNNSWYFTFTYQII